MKIVIAVEQTIFSYFYTNNNSPMKPVLFDGHFGWLHLTVDAHTHGVVLCKPPGHEAQWLHRTFFVLAQQLADKGMPTLRFDYRDNGDSLDDESGAPAYEVWLAGIYSAVRYLREVVGIEHVTLCGIRMGATLAAVAAENCAVDGLILLAPVAHGRVYFREARAIQRIWLENVPPVVRTEHQPGDHIDLLGHRIDAPTICWLQQLDLRLLVQHSTPRILISQPEQWDASALAEHYRALGARVEVFPLPEYTSMMQPTWLSAVPYQALAASVMWATQELPSQYAKSLDPQSMTVGDLALFPPHAREKTISFGITNLFGILCQPSSTAMDSIGGPVVLIANTGGTSHVGEGRFGVFLARYLAQRGFSSLRVDVAGIGDSAADVQAGEGKLELRTMCADLLNASDWLVAYGYTEVIVLGICSGAYLALHAALANTRVTGMIAINLPTLVVRECITLRDMGELDDGSAQAYLQSFFKARKWLEVLHGRMHLSPAIRSLTRYVIERANGIMDRFSGGRFGGHATATREVLQRLERRRVCVRLLYSPLDVGLERFKAVFGLPHHLKKFRHVHAITMDHMDHEVLSVRAREDVAKCCEQMLHERREIAAAQLVAACPTPRPADKSVSPRSAVLS